MDREYVDSSTIESVGYDDSGRVLEVEFKGGGIYQYYDVPEYVYKEFIQSSSLGSYLHHNIRNNYSYSKV